MKFLQHIKMTGVVLATILSLALPSMVHAQANVGAGSISGTVLDPKGASVSAAKVTVISKATGQRLTPAVTDATDKNQQAREPRSLPPPARPTET